MQLSVIFDDVFPSDVRMKSTIPGSAAPVAGQVFTLSVLCSQWAPLAVSAQLAQPPQKTLSIPSPTPEVFSVWNTLPHSFIRLSSVAASSAKPPNLLC